MITAATKHTYLDYEKLPEGAPYQLINGELVMTPSPAYEHQKLLLRLARLLAAFVEERQLGEVVIAPMDVYFAETEVYQPDIIFISTARRSIIQDRIKGTPDLIIEILSPSNAYYDLVHKRNVYEATGVKEYRIVDPQEKTIEVYENVEGQLKQVARAKQTANASEQAGTIGSKLIDGFTIELKDLF